MIVTDIQHGCTHDGPGLRTVVFLKGCPLHCRWCHNPETQSPHRELFFRPDRCIGCMECFPRCPVGAHSIAQDAHILDRTKCLGCMQCAQTCYAGALEPAQKEMTPEEVLSAVLEDRVFYRETGGMTLSGGEPTSQPRELLQLLTNAKEAGIHTCLETCGVFPLSLAEPLSRCTDLILFDIKDTDPVRLKENTGADAARIEENLLALDALGIATVLRCLLIPEVNMDRDHGEKLAKLYRKLKNCRAVELLGYHPYGLSKSAQLGRLDPQYTQPAPEALEEFAALLQSHHIPVKLHGSLLA